METRNLKARLNNGETVYGPFLKIPSGSVIHVLGLAGFDFAIIDLEHSSLSLESAEALVRAARATSLSPVIRVGENTPTAVLHALDMGRQVSSFLTFQIGSRQKQQLGMPGFIHRVNGEWIYMQQLPIMG